MFSVTTAATLAGMTQEEVSNIIFAEIITPYSYDTSSGVTRAVLNERNVRELKIVKRLRSAGIKRNKIKSIVNLLRNSKQSWWNDEHCSIVMCNGERWYITTNAFESKNVSDMKDNESTVIVKL